MIKVYDSLTDSLICFSSLFLVWEHHLRRCEVEVSQAHRGRPRADGKAVGVGTIAFDTSAARPQAATELREKKSN